MHIHVHVPANLSLVLLEGYKLRDFAITVSRVSTPSTRFSMPSHRLRDMAWLCSHNSVSCVIMTSLLLYYYITCHFLSAICQIKTLPDWLRPISVILKPAETFSHVYTISCILCQLIYLCVKLTLYNSSRIPATSSHTQSYTYVCVSSYTSTTDYFAASFTRIHSV